MTPEELATIRSDLEHASGYIDSPDATYNPHALKAMRCAEQLLDENERLKAELGIAEDLVAAGITKRDKLRAELRKLRAELAEAKRELGEINAAVVELAPAPNSQSLEKVGATWELPSQAVVSEAVAHAVTVGTQLAEIEMRVAADKAVLEAADVWRDAVRQAGTVYRLEGPAGELLAAIDARNALLATFPDPGKLGPAAETVVSATTDPPRVCLHDNRCVGIPRFGSVFCAEHDDLPAIIPPAGSTADDDGQVLDEAALRREEMARRDREIAMVPLDESTADGPEQTDGPESLWGKGCPRKVWDGPYSYRCGLGGDGGECAYHGKFADPPAASEHKHEAIPCPRWLYRGGYGDKQCPQVLKDFKCPTHGFIREASSVSAQAEAGSNG